MSKDCCNQDHEIDINIQSKAFQRVVWIALILNLAMFFVEVIYGIVSKSLSLRADAIDFLGDSANYFVTLFVLSSAVKTKANVSLLKAAFMFSFGVWIFIEATISFHSNHIPDSFTMGWVGGLALIVNALVAALLYRFKGGDSNMQSVWLCSRNDAIGNSAVICAGIAVHFFISKWPDLVVAFFMASLSIHSAIQVFRLAQSEIKISKGAL